MAPRSLKFANKTTVLMNHPPNNLKERPIMQKIAHPLKLASMLVAVAGYFLANELQKRETEEIVEKVIARREAEAASINATQ